MKVLRVLWTLFLILAVFASFMKGYWAGVIVCGLLLIGALFPYRPQQPGRGVKWY